MVRPVSDGAAGEAVYVVDGTSPAYSASGHIVYQPSAVTSALWAIPFSAATLEAAGEPFAIARDASVPSVSADGTLVYLDTPETKRMRLFWFDREGREVGAIGRPQAWILNPRVSPQGDSVLVAGGSGREFDIWAHDAEREVLTRLTFDDKDKTAVAWSPDGRQVAIARRASRAVEVLTLGDGSPPRALFSGDSGLTEPLDWSGDGRRILVQQRRMPGAAAASAGVRGGQRPAPGDGPAGGAPMSTIAYLERVGDQWELRDFLPPGPFAVDNGTFSPDGNFVAYESNESGAFNVYVRPFPEGEQRWQVSMEGGRLPRWSADGDEIYFLRDDTLYAVRVDARAGFEVGEPERLFSRDSLVGPRRAATYDVGPDGRFALVGSVGGPEAPGIRVVLNWLSEFAMR